MLVVRRFLIRSASTLLLTALALLPFVGEFLRPEKAFAAANLFVSGPATVTQGDTVNIAITVNTGGQSANAFQGNFSYPTNLFDPIRGTYSGSICTLPIVQPEPDGGSASFSCGRPSGYSGTGTVATIVLKAKAGGSASFGLSGCQVLANDGQGTDITGSCSGYTITVNGGSAATPTPTPAPDSTPPASQPSENPSQNNNSSDTSGGTTNSTKTPTPKSSSSPKASPSPKATPTPDNRTEVPAESANNPDTSTSNPALPGVENLPPATPVPSEEVIEGEEGTATPNQARSIGRAFQDLFSSLQDIRSLTSNMSGFIALLLALIPFLALTFAILLISYRLYLLERRRRRTLDRLFEMELSELAALEGKLDLLAEKGAKGREQYRKEFQRAKENILRQIKPGFNQPADQSTSEPPLKSN